MTTSQEQIEGILHQLKQPGVHALDLLLEFWLPHHEALWKADVRLYRAFARKLISTGHPARAIDLVREGIQRPEHQDDPELRYLLALAFTRGGNPRLADFHLSVLEKNASLPQALRVEVLSLRGRLFKDQYRRLACSNGQGPEFDQELQRLAAESAEMYHRAYEVSGDSWPLTNYATMSVMEGKAERARELAPRIVELCTRLRDTPGGAEDYWLPAQLAEAQIILGDMTAALAAVRDTVRLAGPNSGDVSTFRRNLQLLRQRILTPEMWEALLAECRLGNVLVFAGHLIDRPGHIRGRFPDSPALVRQVQARVKETLIRRNAKVAYCSAACGSDLIFAEQFLAVPNAELHVVLPFRTEDFLQTSVGYGLAAMEPWRTRFATVVAKARQVHHATRESYLQDDVLFAFVNTVLQGLALIRAEERGVEAEAVVVLDAHADGGRGGTAEFVRKWERTGRKCDIIPLEELRIAVEIVDPPSQPAPSQELPGEDVPARAIKAMLFADVKGFSKLAEEHFRRFFATFLQVVRDVRDEAREKPIFCNTWGDGLFVVFADVVAAAEFATRLLTAVDAVDWIGQDFPEKLTLRIGLHCGPVYEAINPLTDRADFYGSHVNRAARIEPVTTPGCAFASEQFAASLTIRSDHHFVCEFVGIENLAKEYDRCPLYRVTRR